MNSSLPGHEVHPASNKLPDTSCSKLNNLLSTERVKYEILNNNEKCQKCKNGNDVLLWNGKQKLWYLLKEYLTLERININKNPRKKYRQSQ